MTLNMPSHRICMACGTLLLLLYILFILASIPARSKHNSENNVQDDYIAQWASDDFRLIDHIRKYYLYSPSTQEYNLVNPNRADWSRHGVAQYAAELLRHQNNGFFVEVGGYDGETGSNSLMFEMYHNFSGLIVEPDETNFVKLVNKNRKAWLVKGCLSGGQFPEKMNFVSAEQTGSLVQSISWHRKLILQSFFHSNEIKIWCFPIGALLRAVKATTVNYFALDVEGAEMSVLESLAGEKDINVQLLHVEYMAWSGVMWHYYSSEKRRKEMGSFLKINLPGMKEKERKFLDIFYLNEAFQIQ